MSTAHNGMAQASPRGGSSKRKPRRRGALALAALTAMAAATAAQTSWAARKVAFSDVKMIIEYNSSAQDIGIQFCLDSEGWQSVSILDPTGQQIYQSTAAGSLLTQGGGTELFVESVEPPLTQLSFADFFARFPEGTYKFTGRTPSGERLTGSAQFTHDVPAGPVVVSPSQAAGCTQGVSTPLVIDWNAVTTSIDGQPLTIVGYEVIVESDEAELDVKMPADAGTALTIPSQFLERGTHYLFEVLAVEASGNQTITEGCFVTA